VPRIYTKTGDDGTTGLLYGGRVSKSNVATDAYGTVDEAVAAIGLARALSGDEELREELLARQRELFVVGADLATNPDERHRLEPDVSLVTDEMVGGLETSIDEHVRTHPLPNAFVVPGANPVSASLDVARAVVRRAERRVVEWRGAGGAGAQEASHQASVRPREEGGGVNDAVVRYLNRLSDLLFVLARIAAGEAEPKSR
jgi:cob(I)alamin adenosyltransferase